jgi:hypothetical protein
MSKSRGGGGGGSKSSGGGSKSSGGGSKSSGGGSKSSSSRSSNVDRPAGSGGRSVEINGRTVTDPKQVERIERNREASARYAVDAYRSEGTPIPSHLRETVDNQIARGDYGSGGGSRNQGSSVIDRSPRPIPRGTPVSSPNFFQRAGDFLQGTRPLVGMGGVINSKGSFLRNPSPGPNVYAGLGQPGMARDDRPVGTMPGTIPESSTPPAEEGTLIPPHLREDFKPVLASEDGTLIPPHLRETFNPVLASDVAVNPASQFTFEQYLAQLQGGQGGGMVAPPPVAPIAGAPSFGMSPGMDQGIGSLVPPPVIAPMQPPPMAGINPPMMSPPVGINPPAGGAPGGQLPILYFGPDGQPVYGGIA